MTPKTRTRPRPRSNQCETREKVIKNAVSAINYLRVDLSRAAKPIKDILAEMTPDSISVPMIDMIGRLITVHQVIPFATDKYGPAAYVLFTTTEGELLNMIVGQSIAVHKLINVIDHLPITCTMVQRPGGISASYIDLV